MKKHIALFIGILFLLLSGCAEKNSIDDKRIVVAASQTPHAEILEQARAYIESKGYEFEIRVFSDYVLPNEATMSGEIDANFFQHLPYLEDYNKNNKTNLVSVLKVHYEPLGLYQGRRKSLDDLQNAKIAIANDNSNGARGLLLLQEQNIIKLDESKGVNVSVGDVVENPYNVEIIELEAAVIPSQLADVDFAVINGNYALEAQVPQSKLLASEKSDSLAAQTYANIIAVRAENKDKEAIKVLVEALSQPNIAEFINDNYLGAVVPLVDHD
ncbi:MAG: metal ABC transporter substrate-binding protein [Acholeplasmataceae bacterium]|nr:metal ABC transporter substrate-binding protein [Acholeplasmataceae bacterium]